MVKRAQVLSRIRALFAGRGILEVDTPALSSSANPDPAIESFCVESGGQAHYLHTSPEFAMKRLLAAGSGDIYQLCKVFRQGERGRNHNPEFTLLEWYRLGLDHHQLMQEVAELIISLADQEGMNLTLKTVTYREIFQQRLNIDPFVTGTEALSQVAREQGIDVDGEAVHCLDEDQWLDLLLSHCIMPELPARQLTLLHDYPASQASLARLNGDGFTAARFEVFWGSLELANGFHELQDSREQRERFEHDNAARAREQAHSVPLDEHLLQALEHGLPDCSGVALGIERLLMKLLGEDSIDAVMAFPLERA